MTRHRSIAALFAVCLTLSLAARAHAQGHPSGGGGRGPGGPPSGGRSLVPSRPMVGDSPSGNVAGSVRNGLQLGPPGRWWDDKSFTRTVGLRKDQRSKMDAVFNANKPAIIAAYQSLQKEQDKLEAVGKDPQLDKAHMFAAIDSVNEARVQLQKAYTQMLLEIRQQLDPDQIAKLETLR